MRFSKVSMLSLNKRNASWTSLIISRFSIFFFSILYKWPATDTPKVEKEIAIMVDQVAEWGFPIRKIELKIMAKDLLNDKGMFLFVT